jgi:hypothetical protein
LIDTARTILQGIDMSSGDYIDARYVVSDLAFAYANETGDWSAAPTGRAAQGAIGASPRAQNFAARDRYARAYSAVMRGHGDRAGDHTAPTRPRRVRCRRFAQAV